MTQLDTLVKHWISEGVISPQQGDQIMSEQTKPEKVTRPRGSLMAEALAYVGGMLVLLAVVILTTIYWPSLTLAARSGIAGVAALTMLVAGVFLPDVMGAAKVRLRAVLWALAVATTGLFTGILVDGLGWQSDDTLFAAASSSAVLATVLWAYQKTVLQQLALAVAVASTVGSAAAMLPNSDEATVGLALWGAGLSWLILVGGALLPPARTGYLFGGAAAVLGAQLTAANEWGLALAAVSVVALICAAVIVRDLWLLGVGAVGVLTTVPAFIDRYFEGELAAPLSLLAAGVLLIAIGIVTARRPRQRSSQSAVAQIAPAVAIALSAVAAAATAAVLVILT